MKTSKSIMDRLAYAYIRRIKRWMFCPSCQQAKMRINKNSTTWICEACGYKLDADEFEDDYIFWFCDECKTYLNKQEGFDRKATKHICRKCGYENDTIFSNVKGVCSDCGEIISDPDGTLCVSCRQERKDKAKKLLINATKVVGTVAAVAGAAYLDHRSFKEDKDTDKSFPDTSDNEEEVYGLGEGVYPRCRTCGATMTGFDGWAWYTCPECENRVRIIDGKETWYNEIFKSGKKQHHSDFELADFCRGGDLTED